MTGLSDNLRAPGINSLSCVQELASSSDMSVEETETPPCEDAQATLAHSSEEELGRQGSTHYLLITLWWNGTAQNDVVMQYTSLPYHHCIQHRLPGTKTQKNLMCRRHSSSSSRRSSDSGSNSLYAGLPPAPGRERMDTADTLLETLPTPDPRLYGRQSSMSAFDCCDRSVNVWETLIPLAASSLGGQGIDVIAP